MQLKPDVLGYTKCSYWTVPVSTNRSTCIEAHLNLNFPTTDPPRYCYCTRDQQSLFQDTKS